MHATLYLPQQPPVAVATDGLALPDATTGFARTAEAVPGLLGCAPELVDVLASGPNYVVYSVFDCEGAVNPDAMAAVAVMTGTAFNVDDDDDQLRGPILVVESGATM